MVSKSNNDESPPGGEGKGHKRATAGKKRHGSAKGAKGKSEGKGSSNKHNKGKGKGKKGKGKGKGKSKTREVGEIPQLARASREERICEIVRQVEHF